MLNREDKFKVVIGFILRTFINILFVIGIMEGFVYSYHFSYKLIADVPYKPATDQVINVTIEPGSSALDVAKLLDQFGIVESRYMMLGRIYLGKYSSKIQAGSYKLGPYMTPDQICRCICRIESESVSTDGS